MDPRTRIQTALNHQQPDRVPLALWGGPYGLVDPSILTWSSCWGWAHRSHRSAKVTPSTTWMTGCWKLSARTPA